MANSVESQELDHLNFYGEWVKRAFPDKTEEDPRKDIIKYMWSNKNDEENTWERVMGIWGFRAPWDPMSTT